MALATILLAPVEETINFHVGGATATATATAKRLVASESYVAQCAIIVPMSGMDAAEEMFDLANNPFRQEERAAKYGSGRSVSVGDIIDVDGTKYLCASCDWIVV